MKKNLVTAMASIVISVILAFSVYAEEWQIDPSVYTNGINNALWAKAECKADILAWADERKEDFLVIVDEKERYEAIANYVCDYLTYDLRYGEFIIYYVLRDGRGLCADYVALSKALCDATGIKNIALTGWTYMGEHAWNRVTLNDVEYYSDITQLDSGHLECLLSQELWEGYEQGAPHENIDWFASYNGLKAGKYVEVVINCPPGYDLISSRKNVNGDEEFYYGKEADADAFWEGEITEEEYNARWIPAQKAWD